MMRAFALLCVVVTSLLVGVPSNAADLVIHTVTPLVSGDDRDPLTSEAFHLRVTFSNSDMPDCSDYGIRLTVNGRAKDARPHWGCGGGGGPWVLLNGVWAEFEPGEYPIRVELDPENEIAEDDETNNVFEGVIRVGAWEAEPVEIEWPTAGRFGIMGDMSSQVHMDLTWFQEGEVSTGAGHACAYDGHNAHDIGNKFQLEAMENGPIAIFAARDGIVTFVQDGLPDRVGDCSLGCGNMIRINHGGGIETEYCHLQRDVMRVQVGDSVVAGQQIASMGNSGCSGGVHVHFVTRLNGYPVDPIAGPNNPNPPVRFRSPPPQDVGLTADSQVIRCGNDDEPGEPRKYYFFPDDPTVGISASFGVPMPTGTQIRYDWFIGDQLFAVNEPGDLIHDQCGATWYWCRPRPTQYAEGEIRVFVDDRPAGVMPFETVPSDFVPPANTAPTPIEIAFRDPPLSGGAAWIEVVVPSFDREYDLISYRYDWFLDGEFIRSHETLAQSDAVPVPGGRCGDRLSCVVTASDGQVTLDPVVVDADLLGEDGEACPCRADLAEPAGLLDLADIIAFVQAFGSGDPIADFASPEGVFDLADVVMFIQLFEAGCP